MKNETYLPKLNRPQGQKGALMSADLILTVGSFSSTEVSARPASDAGRKFFSDHFGAGVSSITLPKSGGLEMAAAAEKDGLTVRED